jgi:cell division protein ZapA
MVDLNIAGRVYPVACRDGEEESLQAAARLVDGKSREAIAGLGTLSEARQFLFAALLLADELLEKRPEAAASAAASAPAPEPAQSAPALDPALAAHADAIAERLELLAIRLENGAETP